MVSVLKRFKTRRPGPASQSQSSAHVTSHVRAVTGADLRPAGLPKSRGPRHRPDAAQAEPVPRGCGTGGCACAEPSALCGSVRGEGGASSE